MHSKFVEILLQSDFPKSTNSPATFSSAARNQATLRAQRLAAQKHTSNWSITARSFFASIMRTTPPTSTEARRQRRAAAARSWPPTPCLPVFFDGLLNGDAILLPVVLANEMVVLFLEIGTQWILSDHAPESAFDRDNAGFAPSYSCPRCAGTLAGRFSVNSRFALAMTGSVTSEPTVTPSTSSTRACRSHCACKGRRGWRIRAKTAMVAKTGIIPAMKKTGR